MWERENWKRKMEQDRTKIHKYTKQKPWSRGRLKPGSKLAHGSRKQSTDLHSQLDEWGEWIWFDQEPKVDCLFLSWWLILYFNIIRVLRNNGVRKYT